MSKKRLLMIDDDPLFLKGYQSILQGEFEVYTATTVVEGMNLIEQFNPDILLLDITLKTKKEGLEVLPHIKKQYPQLPIVIVTNWDSHLIFREAVQIGADDFFIKSDNLNYLKIILQNLLLSQSGKPPAQANDVIDYPVAFSKVMRNVLNDARKVAPAHCPVLISGETGVGKEVVAKYIHQHSKRKNAPFVSVNCGAIPETLVESELFGFERGAFTGAVKQKPGKFEAANGGTLFLDEIEDLPLKAQAALLRVTQELQLEHLGGNKIIPVDVRIITATRHNLQQLVKEGKFREDLFFRLAVYSIFIPPLRKREDDILPLCNYFLQNILTENNIGDKQFTNQALLILKNYRWQGNVRELHNVIESAVIKSRGSEIRAADLFLLNNAPTNRLPYEAAKNQVVKNFQKSYVKEALVRNGGNVSAAANEIGISRQALQKILKEMRLELNN